MKCDQCGVAAPETLADGWRKRASVEDRLRAEHGWMFLRWGRADSAAFCGRVCLAAWAPVDDAWLRGDVRALREALAEAREEVARLRAVAQRSGESPYR